MMSDYAEYALEPISPPCMWVVNVGAISDCCYSSSYITKGRQLASWTAWTEPNTIHDVLPEVLVGVVLQAAIPLLPSQWCPYLPHVLC